MMVDDPPDTPTIEDRLERLVRENLMLRLQLEVVRHVFECIKAATSFDDRLKHIGEAITLIEGLLDEIK